MSNAFYQRICNIVSALELGESDADVGCRSEIYGRIGGERGADKGLGGIVETFDEAVEGVDGCVAVAESGHG